MLVPVEAERNRRGGKGDRWMHREDMQRAQQTGSASSIGAIRAAGGLKDLPNEISPGDCLPPPGTSS
jgi:hypothetical protein